MHNSKTSKYSQSYKDTWEFEACHTEQKISCSTDIVNVSCQNLHFKNFDCLWSWVKNLGTYAPHTGFAKKFKFYSFCRHFASIKKMSTSVNKKFHLWSWVVGKMPIKLGILNTDECCEKKINLRCSSYDNTLQTVFREIWK